VIEELVRQMEANGIRFHPGASEAEIAETEAVLGISLPPSLTTLYRHGNGMIDRFDILNSGVYAEVKVEDDEESDDISQFWRLMSLAELRELHPHLVACGWHWSEAICFWTDDESNYMRLATGGLLNGRIRRLSHDGGDSSYLYRSVESFLRAQAMTGLRGFPHEEAPGRDYPPTTPWSEEQTIEDRAVVTVLWEEWKANPYRKYQPSDDADEWESYTNNRLNLAGIITALTPYEDSETLLPLLDDGDFFIQQYACESLGRRRYALAIPNLITVAQRTIPNSPGRAIKALKRIGTPEALAGLRFLHMVAPHGTKQNLITGSIQTLSAI
jgi:hypothetical protein